MMPCGHNILVYPDGYYSDYDGQYYEPPPYLVPDSTDIDRYMCNRCGSIGHYTMRVF